MSLPVHGPEGPQGKSPSHFFDNFGSYVRQAGQTLYSFAPRWFWIGWAVGWVFIFLGWSQSQSDGLYSAMEKTAEMVGRWAGNAASFAFMLWALAPFLMLGVIVFGLVCILALSPIVLLTMVGQSLWKRFRSPR